MEKRCTADHLAGWSPTLHFWLHAAAISVSLKLLLGSLQGAGKVLPLMCYSLAAAGAERVWRVLV